jgi:hypothetical protein
MQLRSQLHDQTFSSASGFKELTQFNLDYFESAYHKFTFEFRADAIEHDRLANVDCITCETHRIFFADNDALLRRVIGLDPGNRGLVKGRWKVEQGAVFEWGEASIKVVETRIHEMETCNLHVP